MVMKYWKGTWQGMANVFVIVVFITATLILLHVETYMLVFFIISYKRLTYYSLINTR